MASRFAVVHLHVIVPSVMLFQAINDRKMGILGPILQTALPFVRSVTVGNWGHTCSTGQAANTHTVLRRLLFGDCMVTSCGRPVVMSIANSTPRRRRQTLWESHSPVMPCGSCQSPSLQHGSVGAPASGLLSARRADKMHASAGHVWAEESDSDRGATEQTRSTEMKDGQSFRVGTVHNLNNPKTKKKLRSPSKKRRCGAKGNTCIKTSNSTGASGGRGEENLFPPGEPSLIPWPVLATRSGAVEVDPLDSRYPDSNSHVKFGSVDEDVCPRGGHVNAFFLVRAAIHTFLSTVPQLLSSQGPILQVSPHWGLAEVSERRKRNPRGYFIRRAPEYECDAWLLDRRITETVSTLVVHGEPPPLQVLRDVYPRVNRVLLSVRDRCHHPSLRTRCNPDQRRSTSRGNAQDMWWLPSAFFTFEDEEKETKTNPSVEQTLRVKNRNRQQVQRQVVSGLHPSFLSRGSNRAGGSDGLQTVVVLGTASPWVACERGATSNKEKCSSVALRVRTGQWLRDLSRFFTGSHIVVGAPIFNREVNQNSRTHLPSLSTAGGVVLPPTTDWLYGCSLDAVATPAADRVRREVSQKSCPRNLHLDIPEIDTTSDSQIRSLVDGSITTPLHVTWHTSFCVSSLLVLTSVLAPPLFNSEKCKTRVKLAQERNTVPGRMSRVPLYFLTDVHKEAQDELEGSGRLASLTFVLSSTENSDPDATSTPCELLAPCSTETNTLASLAMSIQDSHPTNDNMQQYNSPGRAQGGASVVRVDLVNHVAGVGGSKKKSDSVSLLAARRCACIAGYSVRRLIGFRAPQNICVVRYVFEGVPLHLLTRQCKNILSADFQNAARSGVDLPLGSTSTSIKRRLRVELWSSLSAKGPFCVFVWRKLFENEMVTSLEFG
jgi:hypothetical protein